MKPSKRFHQRAVPAGLLAAVLLGLASVSCSESPLPVEPLPPIVLPPVEDTVAVRMDKFFIAWSEVVDVGNPIREQTITLDVRQDKQYDYGQFDGGASATTLAFAKAHPGSFYIHGDEPDQYCLAPSAYALRYHDFVEKMLEVDPKARFSPAGFSEPNYHCCPGPDDVLTACWVEKHSINYAQDFYDAYKARYGAPPRVDEWRLHDFGLFVKKGDVAAWWKGVEEKAAWATAHGAPMYLGSWGFLAWQEPIEEYREHIKQGMGLILGDSRIVGAAYWSFEYWGGAAHNLGNADGTLTAEGQVYANPLADVPAAPLMTTAAGSQASVRWTNATSAWFTQVDYWRKAKKDTVFTYYSRSKLARRGEAQDSSRTFIAGDSIKARVRYQAPNGEIAPWSDFSKAILVTPNR